MILEILLVNHKQITKPSQFEHGLVVNGQAYKFVGSLLWDLGSHYRAIACIFEKYYMYDGTWTGEFKCKWHNENQDFGNGFFAAKLWYVLVTEDDYEEVPSVASGVGYSEGMSIGPKRRLKLTEEVCVACSQEIHIFTPCVTVVEKSGNLVENVSNYHLKIACCETLRERSEELLEAADKSPYPQKERDEIAEMLQSAFQNNDSEIDLTKDNSKDDSSSSSSIISTVESSKEKKQTKTDSKDESKDDSSSHSSQRSERVKAEEGQGMAETGKKYSLHVGDMIEHTVCAISASAAEAIVIEISTEEDGIIEGRQDVFTDHFHSEMMGLDDDDKFKIVESNHDDAPPKGVWMSLQEVNLTPGNIREGGVGKRAALPEPSPPKAKKSKNASSNGASPPKAKKSKNSSSNDAKETKESDSNKASGKKGKKKKKRSLYPRGLSIDNVRVRGPIPRCKFCGSQIPRGSAHTINRVSHGRDETYTDDRHYHLWCIGELTETEMNRLRARLEETSDVDVDENTKLRVLSAINERLYGLNGESNARR
jgi:hypothetical protein